ncbi:sensor histidine kinase [Psychromonas sp. 14N.309.X.WAT.B.A12]|uniref:sensor histidine kinase n=1 Tax=unclassified Psychromonas TaxID=2614957 RepID=UPI0025B0F630|nr:ATP-binding protein [Psychromonas sp. 14N.309.X.WAT.B.A12]MDN2663907.1 ATP-binding protein [Psychromonas sp. 14N.309.X.WAT.B.A12]
MKSNIYSVLVFLLGLAFSYFISVHLTEKEKIQQQQNILLESKSIAFNIRNSIESNAEQIQLLISHWTSIEDLNGHWEMDTNLLINRNRFLTTIKLFPMVDESLFDLPPQTLIKAANEIEKRRQLRARDHLPKNANQVVSNFVYTTRASYLPDNNIELKLQFPIVINDQLIAYVEVPMQLGMLLNHKLDTYQITKPFAISENGTVLFNYLPERLHINNITKESTIHVFGHTWKLMVWSNIIHQEKGLFLILSLLVSLLAAIVVKLGMLNHTLYKNDLKNKHLIRQVDDECKSSQAKLIQSNKLASLGEIAAGIAHEINQPLQVICIHTDICQENIKNGNYHLIEKSFKAITTQSERIENIVKQVGSFGRDSELDNYQHEEPNRLFNNVISIVINQYKQDQVELRQVIPSSLPLLFCNKTQIEQVLVNLLINAKDSVETSERKVVFFKAHAQDHKLYIQISDSGTGIDPSKVNDIFTPFYTTKPLGKGTGLGLSISYSIIHQHQGHIKVSSEIGHGSVFTVILPFEKPKASLN